MKQWYVAKTQPKKEKLASRNLASLGIETYWPEIRRYDTPQRRIEGLFPGYLFCRIEENSSLWPRARWAVGLSYFLGSDGMPSPIPEEMVDLLKERTRGWNTRPPRPLQAGEKVTVMAGPFAGLEGIFQRYASAQERCQILLQTLGGLLTVELPSHQLKLAPEAALLRA